MNSELVSKILSLKNEGLSSRKISKIVGVCKSTVNNLYNKFHKQNTNPPKILLLDIETASSITATFGRFKQTISQSAVIKEGGWLLSYAYKWLGASEVQGERVTSKEALACDDSRLCMQLLDILENCDYCVWHNGNAFDFPMINTRMVVNGLPPIRKIASIDTLNLVKRDFRFNSNKLDSLCSQLDIGRKTEHAGISMWVDCQNGCEVALDKMLEYNKQDIFLLEELYLAIRPYSRKHPNLSVHYQDAKMRCNCCCSTEVEPTGNTVTTNLSVFTEYVCKSCGARFKDRASITTKEQRKNFLSN